MADAFLGGLAAALIEAVEDPAKAHAHWDSTQLCQPQIDTGLPESIVVRGLQLHNINISKLQRKTQHIVQDLSAYAQGVAKA